MQNVNQEELKLAQQISKFREDKKNWIEVQERFGLGKRAAINLLCRAKLPFQFHPYPGGKHDPERNKLILEFVMSPEGQGMTQDEIASHLARVHDRADINRGVVNGVIARARYQGLPVPPKRCGVGPNGSRKPPATAKQKRSAGFFFTEGEGPKEVALPPRTPELLAKGRVSYDDLRPGTCRYTPNAEAPYFFCGEAVGFKPNGTRRSWCDDCFHNIILLKEDEIDAETDTE